MDSDSGREDFAPHVLYVERNTSFSWRWGLCFAAGHEERRIGGRYAIRKALGDAAVRCAGLAVYASFVLVSFVDVLFFGLSQECCSFAMGNMGVLTIL